LCVWKESVQLTINFTWSVAGGARVGVLSPVDIEVIAAMGDSLTAGSGILADNVLQIFVENRGVSATGGSQGTWRQCLTLPNIIKVRWSHFTTICG